MTIQRIGVAIQIPDKLVQDINKMAEQINTSNVMNSFMSNIDFVVNDFNSMLCDYITDRYLERPGHFDDAIDNYHDTVVMLFQNEHSRKNSYDAQQCKRKADEYICAAIDFAHEVIRTGQLNDLQKRLSSIEDKQHTIIMPAKLVMHDELGTFITRYDVMPVDEFSRGQLEAF